jgi:hypothetical protein
MPDDGWMEMFSNNQRETRFEGLCRIAAQQMLRIMIPLFPLAR